MKYKLLNHVIQTKRFFIYKINAVSFEPRIALFDKKYPFVLTVDYREFNQDGRIPLLAGVAPGIILNSFNLSHVKEYKFYLQNENECQFHVEKINKKKMQIEEFLDKFSEI